MATKPGFEEDVRELSGKNDKPKLTKKQKAMGMNGKPITVDSGWLDRVTNNFIDMSNDLIDTMLAEGAAKSLLKSEGIVIVEIVEQETDVSIPRELNDDE